MLLTTLILMLTASQGILAGQEHPMKRHSGPEARKVRVSVRLDDANSMEISPLAEERSWLSRWGYFLVGCTTSEIMPRSDSSHLCYCWIRKLEGSSDVSESDVNVLHGSEEMSAIVCSPKSGHSFLDKNFCKLVIDHDAFAEMDAAVKSKDIHLFQKHVSDGSKSPACYTA